MGKDCWHPYELQTTEVGTVRTIVFTFIEDLYLPITHFFPLNLNQFLMISTMFTFSCSWL